MPEYAKGGIVDPELAAEILSEIYPNCVYFTPEYRAMARERWARIDALGES